MEYYTNKNSTLQSSRRVSPALLTAPKMFPVNCMHSLTYSEMELPKR